MHTRYKPAALIDIATLTGACVVALGQFAIGMFGTDAKLKEHSPKSRAERPANASGKCRCGTNISSSCEATWPICETSAGVEAG